MQWRRTQMTVIIFREWWTFLFESENHSKGRRMRDYSYLFTNVYLHSFVRILRITSLVFIIYYLATSASSRRLVSQPFAVAGSITPNRRQRSRSTLTSAKNAIEGLRADKYLDRRSTQANLWSTETSGLEKPRLSRGGVTTFARPVIISRHRIVSLTSRRLVRKPDTGDVARLI